MTELVTLELPDTLAHRAKAEALRTNRPLEAVLLDWLSQVATAEPPVDSLPDDQVLALSNAQMEPQLNEELSQLLARNRGDQLDDAARRRLDELMHLYRTSLTRKAQALKVALDRGLRPALN